MSELKAGVLVTPHNEGMCFHRCSDVIAVAEGETEFYLKSETDKAFEDLEESHKKEVEQLLMEIVGLKNRIAPKQSDKTLQERLNEVCKKHGVSTLQDLEWAFCESEKGRARDFIESVKAIAHQKYKRCIAMAKYCEERYRYLTCLENWQMTDKEYQQVIGDYWDKWHKRWLELSDKFKPNSTAQ